MGFDKCTTMDYMRGLKVCGTTKVKHAHKDLYISNPPQLSMCTERGGYSL